MSVHTDLLSSRAESHMTGSTTSRASTHTLVQEASAATLANQKCLPKSIELLESSRPVSSAADAGSPRCKIIPQMSIPTTAITLTMDCEIQALIDGMHVHRNTLISAAALLPRLPHYVLDAIDDSVKSLEALPKVLTGILIPIAGKVHRSI